MPHSVANLCSIQAGSENTDADVILFVHGLMTRKEIWRQQIERFSQEYRTIAVDLCGFGESRIPDMRASYSQHADDIASFFRENNIANVHLVGWSLGASVAICFANKYPSMLSSVTLVGGSPKAVADEDFPFGVSTESARQMADAMRTDAEGVTAALVNQMIESNRFDAFSDELTEMISQEDFAAGAHHLEIAIDTDLRGYLPAISAPVLVCYGELDPFSPPAVNEYMTRHLPNAELVEMADAAHLPFLTKPVEFNTVLETFLQRQRRSH